MTLEQHREITVATRPPVKLASHQSLVTALFIA
jgi:hypothetical protein